MNIKKTILGGWLGLALAVQVTATSLSPGYVLGTISDGTPASNANETLWVNALINATTGSTTTVGDQTLVRSANSFPTLPAAVFSYRVENRDLTLQSLTGISYILGKYGNSVDGGQQSVVWYVGALTGTGYSIPTPGLSHVTYFTSDSDVPTPGVPEGGSTVALLGLAVAALALLRRKF